MTYDKVRAIRLSENDSQKQRKEVLFSKIQAVSFFLIIKI